MSRCKTVLLFFCCLILFSFTSSPWSQFQDTGKGVRIETDGGVLHLIPLNERTIRVSFRKKELHLYPDELIYCEKVKIPAYQVMHDAETITLKMESIVAVFNKEKRILCFTDQQGNLLLSEKAEGRILEIDSIDNLAVNKVMQRFDSPPGEYLFGTGQFQDGHLNIRGLSRRLTQVNSQIAIPFILSSRGYGLLWNNYGLTDFNPA